MIIDSRLEKIAPLWYAKLKRIRTLKGLLTKTKIRTGLVTRTLDLEDYSSCMVGESYGFARNYSNEIKFLAQNMEYCKECLKFSDQVVVAPRNPKNYSIVYFQNVITKFLDHVEKDHGVDLS